GALGGFLPAALGRLADDDLGDVLLLDPLAADVGDWPWLAVLDDVFPAAALFGDLAQAGKGLHLLQVQIFFGLRLNGQNVQGAVEHPGKLAAPADQPFAVGTVVDAYQNTLVRLAAGQLRSTSPVG